MIALLPANELKTRGITAIDQLAQDNDGIIITVRGKQKYVVLPVSEYNQLREYELEAAIREARADLAAGRYQSGTVEEHLERLADVPNPVHAQL